MAEHPVLIAVDVGTSGARAVVFDVQGRERAQHRQPYITEYPRPGWSEQDPDRVTWAVIEVLRRAAAALPSGAALAGVVFSTQMYSIMALGVDDAPLTRSLTWGDVRSAALAAELRRTAPTLPQRTGCPIQAIYPLAKIVWLRRHLDLPQTARFVSIKDYVLLRLTGQLVTDWSTASASGLLDIARHAWDDEALAACALTRDRLAPLVSPRQIIRRWQGEIAHTIGIAADTPLIVGAGDAPLANIGVGATASGTLAVNIGTSAAARALTDQPQIDVEGRLWTYAADVGHWVVGGMIGSGGVVYEWLLKELLAWGAPAHNDLFAAAEALAADIPPGADDLLFIPYLTGEQSPGWRADARGQIVGLTLRHRTGHLVRAAIEGIAFALLRAAQPIADVRGHTTEKLYLTGGLSASALWQRVIADVFGVPVVVPHSSESSARGAAIVGLLALGLASSYAPFAQTESLLLPDADVHARYRERFEVWRLGIRD